MPETLERTALYRLYDKTNQLLYIGISVRPEVRWGEHSIDKPWWHLVHRRTVEWLDVGSNVQGAEVAAIKAERPLYNGTRGPDGMIVRHRYDDSADAARIAGILRERMKEGLFDPGGRVIRSHLAAEFGVSPATITAALNRLPRRAAKDRRDQHRASAPRTPAERRKLGLPVMLHDPRHSAE